MDKAAYFQSVYEAQFALGKKTGACLSAQYLALEAFLQRSPDWHYQWWSIVGITPRAWLTLRQRAAETAGTRMISSRGLIRAHLHDRVARGRTLFERHAPLPDAWYFYEARDTTVLALTEERDIVATLPWLSVDPEVFGQHGQNRDKVRVTLFNSQNGQRFDGGPRWRWRLDRGVGTPEGGFFEQAHPE